MSTKRAFLKRTPIVPPGQQQRVGDTQVLDFMYYDTLLYGSGQTIANENPLFVDAQRVRDENLCNLKLQGQLTDNRQFAVYRFGLLLWSQTAPVFYDMMTYFSRFIFEQQEARKTIIWGDQAGAGGGVYGFDQNAAAFHLTNGVPAQNNQWTFSTPLIFLPSQTFEVVHKVMPTLAGGTLNPVGVVNADTDDNRLFRVYLRGIEGRDIVNA